MLDKKALAACLARVELNPVRENVVAFPETSDYTSIQERIQTAFGASRANGRTA